MAVACNINLDYLKVEASDGSIYYFAKDNYTYNRLDDLRTDKNFVESQYKKVSKYEDINTIQSLITKYSDPVLQLDSDEIIAKLVEQFNISIEIVTKEYDDWRNMYEKNLREGKNILKKKIYEPGVKINFNQMVRSESQSGS